MTAPAHVAATRAVYDAVAMDYDRALPDLRSEAPLDRAVIEVFAAAVRGRGPVGDLGCGTGRLTAHLASLGVDVFGLDLSPGMIAVAREQHPGQCLALGSLRELPVAAGSLVGAVAWYSIIHTPRSELPIVIGELARVLAPGGELLLAFQTGDGPHRVESPYGHDVVLDVHWHPPEVVGDLVEAAGLVVTARIVQAARNSERSPQAMLTARRPDD